MPLSREVFLAVFPSDNYSVESLSVMLQRNFGCESDTACGLPMKISIMPRGLLRIASADSRVWIINITLKAGNAKSSIQKISLTLFPKIS
jgi:hypothetical protein